MKAKNYSNDFWVGEVKNGCGLLRDRALTSSVSQEEVDELS